MKRKEPAESFDSTEEPKSKRSKPSEDGNGGQLADAEDIMEGKVLMNPRTKDLGNSFGPELKIRDGKQREEERNKLLYSRIVTNDGTHEMLLYLFKLKQIFCHQLPNMPREYITRLVMDRKHKAVCLIRKEPEPKNGVDEKVVGGIHFRDFREQGFIEIVFCAISADEQLKGYGTFVMTLLKKYARQENVLHFITYADDLAIDYFKRQGFSREIELDKKIWGGYIKDYEGATMMHCRLDPRVVDEAMALHIKTQRKHILEKLRELSNQHVKYKGIDAFKRLGAQRLAVENLKPLVETGWPPETYSRLMSEETQRRIKAVNEAFLTKFKADKDSWPFHEPVNVEEVTDYLDVIKDPIDIRTMEERLARGNYYITQEMLVADLKRMLDNCRKYNRKGSGYYEIADKLDTRYLAKWRPSRLDEPLKAAAPAMGYPQYQMAPGTPGAMNSGNVNGMMMGGVGMSPQAGYGGAPGQYNMGVPPQSPGAGANSAMMGGAVGGGMWQGQPATPGGGSQSQQYTAAASQPYDNYSQYLN